MAAPAKGSEEKIGSICHHISRCARSGRKPAVELQSALLADFSQLLTCPQAGGARIAPVDRRFVAAITSGDRFSQTSSLEGY